MIFIIPSYNESTETFIDYQKTPLKDVEKIELAPETGSNQLFFKSNAPPKFHVIRLHYMIPSSSLTESSSGYFHTFRSCNLRFFNNLVITTKSNDELTEALRGLCHTIQSTASYFDIDIPFEEVAKVTR